MPHLSIEDRGRVIGHHQAGVSVAQIAKIFNISKKSVYKLIKKYNNEGTVKRTSGSGRHRKTTTEVDALIVQQHELNRFRSPSETAIEVNVSSRTVRRRLREQGLTARKPACKPLLKQHHREARLAWAATHQRWTQAQWENVLFTDESSFSVSIDDNRLYCYRRKHERYLDECINQSLNRGYGSINVWGGIIGGRRLPLVSLDTRLTGETYINNILIPHILPFIRNEQRLNNIVILQQDNAPPHKANIVKAFMTDNEIQVLPWPAVSPDINCIENLWANMGRALRTTLPRPTNGDELFRCLQAIWNQISEETVTTLTKSMRSRALAVVSNDGGHIKY